KVKRSMILIIMKRKRENSSILTVEMKSQKRTGRLPPPLRQEVLEPVKALQPLLRPQ
ncbi:hypothetical protein P7K49_027764, partial [Saguinus oedipus]